MRVLTLYNPIVSDRPDDENTLQQIQEISYLDALGHTTSRDAICHRPDSVTKAVRRHRPDIVCNLVESFLGSDHYTYLVAEQLEILGIPYTGCGSEAIFLAGDKLRAKRLMEEHGVATPAFLDDGESDGVYIVKSATEHASFGIDHGSVVRGKKNARALMERKITEKGGSWFAETYIPGREVNVALLGMNGVPDVLPIAEILFERFDDTMPHIVDYAAKWEKSSHAYLHTPRAFLSAEKEAPLLAALRAIALQCWRIFNLSGYARVDFRIDKTGKPWVLEINDNPCLSVDAGFMAAAQQAGFSSETVIQRIIDEGLHAHYTRSAAYALCA